MTTYKEYKENLENDEFMYESECGTIFYTQVSSRNEVLRTYCPDNLLVDLTCTLTENDIMCIENLAYDFTHVQSYKTYDKMEKY